MHVRISTFTSVRDVARGVTLLREQVVPQLQQLRGFRGVSAAGDSAAGLLRILSRWDSEMSLDANEGVASGVLADIANQVGADVITDRYEQAVWKAVGSGSTDAVLHIQPITIDQQRIDSDIEFLRRTLVADMERRPGLSSVGHLINRSTGAGAVSSVWDDEGALMSYRGGFGHSRAVAEDRGIALGDDQVLQVLFFAL
jgi:hypothetical protein